MVSSKGEVMLSTLKAFPHSQEKKKKKYTTCTVEKFGPRNSIFIAWFVNENKNKTSKKKIHTTKS